MKRHIIKRKSLLVISLGLLVMGGLNYAYAKEITILYSGETHAMLYPCHCPIEPDGGVARRAALIKQLRHDNPDMLLLDSGGFFAGGLMDEYTQNTPLDMQRTRVNLKAMELMKYDAVNIGDDEFNFGKEFLKELMGLAKTNFLSCNISFEKALPYIIKEVGGAKIGIIGLTTPEAAPKAGGVNFAEPVVAVTQTLAELKKKGTDIIVLLSHQGEADDLKLLEEVKGIDILISGHSRLKEEAVTKVGSTIFLRPSWQGRRLGKLSLTLKDNRIANFEVKELRLSDKVGNAPEILAILPGCFSDGDCRKPGFIGTCQAPGTATANCLFATPVKVALTVITPELCRACDTDKKVNQLKVQIPGLVASFLYYPNPRANKLISDLKIKTLPAYLFGKELEKEKNFEMLKESLEARGEYYLLKPQASGIAYFTDRERKKGAADLFVSFYDAGAAELLDIVKDMGVNPHFLAVEKDKGFDAARGNLEVEEYLRAVCVKRYYPERFWDYIICRTKNINSSWWESCLDRWDPNKIKTCAQGQEGSDLLKENIGLNKQLGIMRGPTYLLDNQEIFSSRGVPRKEELKKILQR